MHLFVVDVDICIADALYIFLTEPFFASLGHLVLATFFAVLPFFWSPVPWSLAIFACCLTLFMGYRKARGTMYVPKEGDCIDMSGKTVVITGANAGLGKQLALECLRCNAKTIVLACRNMEKAERAASWIRRQSCGTARDSNVVVMRLDLASMESVRSFVREWGDKSIDVLFNNAGVMMCPLMYTKDGIEQQFGVNHLGHFLLTYLLLDVLKRDGVRVVNVSSYGHFIAPHNIDWRKPEENYNRQRNYAISKLANIYHTYELNSILEQSGGAAYSAHPGTCNTELMRHMLVGVLSSIMAAPMWYATKTAHMGIQTLMFCATSSDAVPGQFHQECALSRVSQKAMDKEEARRLWRVSKELVGLL